MITRTRAGAVAAIVLTAMAATGCSRVEEMTFGSGSPAGPEFSTGAPRPSESPPGAATPAPGQPSAPDDPAGGFASCIYTEVVDESANAELVAATRAIYEQMDCASSQSLESQLLAARDTPELTGSLEKNGWVLDWSSTTDSANVTTHSLGITSLGSGTAFSSCSVSVTDSPRSKLMLCMDDGDPAPEGA